VAAGDDVAEAIAGIMGVAIEAKEPDIARPGCTYGVAAADTKYIYNGLSDCRAASLLSGGMKVCNIGCLGLGSCVSACQFNALSMGPEGLPVVNEDNCTGCGACERVCPKHIINLSSVTRRILREYTRNDCTTPCQRACPAGIDICRYIEHIQNGDYERSLQVIKERNPFPTVIGRICPRPCEDVCRRGLADESVAINYLKRYVADREHDSGEHIQPYKAPATGRTIAVVGGGVQGISTAFFCARLGHQAKVFEATNRLGGLLRSAIAASRLPADILDWDIAGVQEMGVEARTGQRLGADFSVDSLLADEFEAVFLATGGWDSRLARGVITEWSQPVPGMVLMIDLLRSDPAGSQHIECGKRTVIVGGGVSAVKAVQQCKALGAETVTVLFRDSEADVALLVDSRQALADEVAEVHFNVGITRLFGQGQRLIEIEITDLEDQSTAMMAADTVVMAAGRLPQLLFVKRDRYQTENNDAQDEAPEAAQLNGPLFWEAFEPYKDATIDTEPGLLASGDSLSDFSAAISAIGAGRRAAASIHQTLYGIKLSLPANVLTAGAVIQDLDEIYAIRPFARRIMPVDLSPEAKELEKGFDEHTARSEAARCLQCGLICYRHYSDSEQPAAQLEQAG
jgi:NADPH-dependent glutamate synthase beta subunit-like oxidoreductase/NAD-dependent dihydropyrimidine dehydrogenase PreA subunit